VSGKGVKRNVAEGVRWYRKAAEQGDVGARYNLGVMYDNGRGVPKNEAEAARWYRKAAEQGLAPAQYNLGVMYDNSQGVPKDDVEAYFWLNLGASSLDDATVRSVRDKVGENLSPEKRLEVQERCRKWAGTRPSNPNTQD
jgi:TPR repeat protein